MIVLYFLHLTALERDDLHQAHTKLDFTGSHHNKSRSSPFDNIRYPISPIPNFVNSVLPPRHQDVPSILMIYYTIQATAQDGDAGHRLVESSVLYQYIFVGALNLFGTTDVYLLPASTDVLHAGPAAWGT